MSDRPAHPHVVGFDRFEVDLRSGELRREGSRLPLQDQPFRVLARLLQRPGEVVTREELRHELWPDNTFLDFEHGVNAAIKRLRDALGDSAESPRFIETLPRRGYRFIARIDRPQIASTTPVSSPEADSRIRSWRPTPAAALTILLAAAAGIVWLLWPAPDSTAPQADASTQSARDLLDRPRVAVGIFENRTADPAFDALGAQIAGRLIRMMAQVPGVDVTPHTVDARAGREDAAVDNLVARAQNAGAVLLVAGAIFLHGDRLELQSRILDVPGGRLLHALAPFTASRREPAPAIDSLERHAAGAVAVHFDEFFGGLEFVSDPPAIEAYREYRTGLEVFSADYPRALAHLQRAVDMAPQFSLPRVIMLFAYWNTGELEKVRAELAHLQSERHRLALAERLFVDFLREDTEGRSAEALRVLQDLERLVPHSLLVNHNIVQLSVIRNRPRAAVEAHDRLRSDVRTLRYSIGTWRMDFLTRALHLLGEHERELAESHRGQQYAPGWLLFMESEVRALAALGRLEDLYGVVDRSLAIPASSGQVSRVLEQAALALRAHGYKGASIELANRAIDWQRAQSQGTTNHSDRFFPGRSLYLAERWEEAARIFEQLAAESPEVQTRPPERAQRLGWVGLCAARRGEAARARAVFDQIGGLTDPYTYGERSYWRSRIAAVLGERQTAVDLLRDAIAQGLPFGLHLHHNPDFEALRDYPPFSELMRSAG